MIEITHFIQTVGNTSLDYVWLPVIIWTIIALPITLFLHRSETIPPVYQYHSRIALTLALPLGILGSYLTEVIGEALTTAEAVSAKFIVIQNPITVSATDSQATLWNSLSDPVLWIGVAGFLLLFGVGYHLVKLILNMIQLKKLGRNLTFQKLDEISQFTPSQEETEAGKLNPLVAFSDQANIPFTYGWIKTKIVIPAELKSNPEKMTMAIRHELMHIKHKDFLLNGALIFIKAFFWFHPLVHYLYKSSQEFREIICDGQVLEDTQLSRKRYASLLFELAEREYRNSDLAMSMAVNPSSLKKRIKIMSTQNISTSTLRSSFLLTLATAALVVLTISCSDLNDEDGITNTEFQQAQAQMDNQAQGDQPLYVLNGEEITQTDPPDALSRMKSEYIKSINVLKDQKAVDQYGQAGQNGVIEIQFIDGISKEEVFSDLKDEADQAIEPKTSSEGDFFVAVEDMPELIGGLGELQKKITYPEEAREAGEEGRVIIKFIVNEQGDVENPQVIRGVSESLDQEALRVVEQAKFKPGRQRGQAVRVQYSLPMIFRLDGNGDSSEKQSISSASDENEKSVNSLDEIAVVGYTELESPEVENSQMALQNVEANQNGTLTGKVVSVKDNTPLAGANVVMDGTNKGASTDQNGEFSIQGLSQGTHNLTISYVGYEAAEGTITIE